MIRTNAERETIIRFDRAEDTCSIYTADKTIMTRLDKLYKCTKEYADSEGVYAKEYTTNKRLISFRTDANYKPEYVPQRIVSPEQVARLQQARQQKNIIFASNSF